MIHLTPYGRRRLRRRTAPVLPERRAAGSTDQRRQSGLGTSGSDGLLTAESVSTDIHGLETISRSYENGRISGLNASGYSLSYGYDPADGRFDSLTYQPETPEEQSFSYGYLPNSNLLETLSSSHGLTVTREY
ncbi:MAG: hypothetical protein GY801_01880, partial [bacterium]|nr:hypothetical protein [bacterium]